jgi:hypothetical protein
VAQTYTLEDEQEEDNLIKAKEMRAQGDNENKNSSKRPKVSLNPNETTK